MQNIQMMNQNNQNNQNLQNNTLLNKNQYKKMPYKTINSDKNINVGGIDGLTLKPLIKQQNQNFNPQTITHNYDNGEYIKIRKYFNEHRSQFTVLDKEGVQQNRITVGSDRYNHWLEEIYSHKLYKKDYSNVKQSYFNLKLHADNGITKMEKLLNKYIILFESQLPTIRQLILLGRNKAFS